MIPFFSIIIPVYNVAPYLRECLDSVLAQTFTDWEAICVDDGSTDGSGAILDKYAAKDKRFKIIHQENAGVSTARNKAIWIAKGIWVGFVDGDDVIACDWFLVAAKATGMNAAAKWIHMGFSFWRDSNPIPQAKNVHDVVFKELGSSETIIDGWKSILPHGYPWRNFYKRDLLSGHEFNCKLRIQEDMYYSLNLLPHIGISVWTDYDGYFYRYRQQSAWNGRMRLEDAENNLTELLAVWKPQSPFILKNPEKMAVQKLIAKISVKIIFERFLHQFGLEQKNELKRVIALIRQAHAERAFTPWVMPGSYKDKVRWFLFVITGSSLAFRPLRYFFRFEWLRSKR